MGIDHSATYKDGRLRNLPHRKRLGTILSILEREAALGGKSYADVGCSNGYLTGIIYERLKPARACGFDHDPSNLARAKENYPDIDFRTIDLNRADTPQDRYDLVTSFEVLEHVGDLENALGYLLSLTRPGAGLLLMTVPIEIGWRGIAKFLAKTVFYGYSLSELPRQKYLHAKYLMSLVAGRRMSCFRNRKDGWGTHFGFDYRDIDEYLRSRGVAFEARNHFTSRFYLVRR